jgi:peptidoglycan/xylan/chitin deacetylase (PgdA/CDA1 family)
VNKKRPPYFPGSGKKSAWLFGISGIFLTLLFSVCASTGSPRLTAEPPKPGALLPPSAPVPYSAGAIASEIDANWRILGYKSRPDKFMAITFDDGPSGPGTLSLLGILERNRVKATFFLTGENVSYYPASVRAIFDAGHELGNHSWDGETAGAPAGGQAVRAKLENTSEGIRSITGTAPVLFRPPNLEYDRLLRRICAGMGLVSIGASCIGRDYEPGISAGQIVRNILAGAEDGGIILLHEPNTAPAVIAALQDIIDRLRARGFWLMPIGQLAALKGKTLAPGTMYDRIN